MLVLNSFETKLLGPQFYPPLYTYAKFTVEKKFKVNWDKHR